MKDWLQYVVCRGTETLDLAPGTWHLGKVDLTQGGSSIYGLHSVAPSLSQLRLEQSNKAYYIFHISLPRYVDALSKVE